MTESFIADAVRSPVGRSSGGQSDIHPDDQHREVVRRFDGRTAIVTGASRGIGAETARRLASEGANVVLVARSAADLAAVTGSIRQSGGNAVAAVADAAEPAQLDSVVERAMGEFGAIHVLVNNAGVLPAATRTEHIGIEEWERVLRINLTAPWYLATRCHDLMGSTGGVVINVLSPAAFYPSVGLSSYSVSKAALTMATKALALEWARDAIRVVGVAPGKVDTVLVKPILEFTERKGLRVNPLGRVAAPSEVAALIAFLASDEAAYATGCVITFDGGEVAASGADAAR